MKHQFFRNFDLDRTKLINVDNSGNNDWTQIKKSPGEPISYKSGWQLGLRIVLSWSTPSLAMTNLALIRDVH